MVQAIFKRYLTSMGADNQYGSHTIEQHIILTMRGNNQYGSNNIQPISYNYWELITNMVRAQLSNI